MREALTKAGWSQFSFLREADHSVCGDIEIEKDERVIVITHSCDLLNDSADEPRVECIVATPVSEQLPQPSTQGNPRIFSFSAYDKGTGKEQAFKVRSASRFEIDKGKLAELAPDETISLHSPSEVQGFSHAATTFARWLARRYDRVALPDEFVRRAKVTGQMKLCYKRMFDKGMRDLRAVVSPNEELSPEDATPYQLLLFAYLKEGSSTGERTEVLKELRQFKQLIQNPAIDITLVTAIAIEEASFLEFAKSHPFDLLSY